MSQIDEGVLVVRQVYHSNIPVNPTARIK